MKIKARRKIARELPPVGTQLIGRFRKVSYSARVVSDKTSSIGRSIEYSRVKYPSMTAAAATITKHPVNGWRFWKIHKE